MLKQQYTRICLRVGRQRQHWRFLFVYNLPTGLSATLNLRNNRTSSLVDRLLAVDSAESSKKTVSNRSEYFLLAKLF